jgi:hypothetical protein
MSDGGPAPAPDFDDVEIATLEPPAQEAVANLRAAPLAHPFATDWPGFVRKIKEERIHVGSLLQHTRPIEADEDKITVAVPDAFHQRLLSSQEAFLLQHLNALAAGTLRKLRFVIQETQAEVPDAETAGAFDPYAYLQRKRLESPALQALLDRFGGELVW